MCDNEMPGMMGKHSIDRNMALNSNIATCIMELHSPWMFYQSTVSPHLMSFINCATLSEIW